MSGPLQTPQGGLIAEHELPEGSAVDTTLPIKNGTPEGTDDGVMALAAGARLLASDLV